MNRERLAPLMTEEIRLTLRSFDKGSYLMKPKIICADTTGHQISCKPKPVKIDVLETVLPDRVSTGYEDLDGLLFGGIPENYAVILTSPPLDERDLLVQRFLDRGVKKHQTIFHITIDPRSVKGPAEETRSNLHLFICNPQAATITNNLPNIHRLNGVDNLTDISIALNKATRRLDTNGIPRRACIEIISDVLLQHKAVLARKWLNDLITELKSKDFTILALMNPQMHSPQEVHAILGLFEGEIAIHEKQSGEHSGKFLKVKRMHGQKYLGSTIPLRKENMHT